VQGLEFVTVRIDEENRVNGKTIVRIPAPPSKRQT
jgi:hypothetical protein